MLQSVTTDKHLIIKGKDALETNSHTVSSVVRLIETALGPAGSAKMIVNAETSFFITTRGGAMLRKLFSNDPILNLMKDGMKSLERECYDGIKTALVILGRLLSHATSLRNQGIHPNVVIRGYNLALKKVMSIAEKFKLPVTSDAMLTGVAESCVTGKLLSPYRQFIARMAVDAVMQLWEKRNGPRFLRENVTIVKKTGGSFHESKLVKGTVLRNLGLRFLYPGMPRHLQSVRVLLSTGGIERGVTSESRTSYAYALKIQDAPELVEYFVNHENEKIVEAASRLSQLGVNLFCCKKGIDDLAESLLAKRRIIGLRRLEDEQLKVIARTTGAKLTGSIEEATAETLGQVDEVSLRKVEEEDMLFITSNKSNVVTLLLRGQDSLVDEAEGCLNAAVSSILETLVSKTLLPGGGACEIEFARFLRGYAQTLDSREQLAVEAFAKSLLSIPELLAKNAGLNPIDILPALQERHANGQYTWGVDATSGSLVDVVEAGILIPPKVLVRALTTATEMVTQILRVDALLVQKEEPVPKPPRQETQPTEDQAIRIEVEKTEERY